jgi:hypothetical protein
LNCSPSPLRPFQQCCTDGSITQQFEHNRKASNIEIEEFCESYKKNPNHFLSVPLMWKPTNHGNLFFKSLWDFDKNYEQVSLFVGYVS